MNFFPDHSNTAMASDGQIMTGQSDGELLKLFCAHRSEAAFRELVRRHSGVVQAAARRRLGGDNAMADDVVQQTFILLARQPARAVRAISLSAWLHRAATYEASNLLRGEIRHRRRMAEVSETVAAGEADPPDAWLAALPFLDEALASLNETDRSLILMHHMEGLNYEQVGARLQCSGSAAQRRGHRALEILAARL
jgi:RNA polymerase sigma factor (sigma-70 family)